MGKRNALIAGTFILTITGLLSRIIGFFYRIFLSNTIGAEGMGIYQLIFPVYIICFSLTAASIQTAISKFVAASVSLKDKKASKSIFTIGLVLSLSLSVLVSFILYQNASFIAENILLESRCTPLLKILAFSIPFGSIHSCVNGYYYGIKKAGIPSLSQLFEQLARVLCVYLLYIIYTESGKEISTSIAVTGIVVSEGVAALFSGTAILINFNGIQENFKKTSSTLMHLKNIVTLSLPLTANRLIINLLQSAEAIFIPNRLRKFGFTVSESLSVYGILTGMALPLILFPTALTNSISVMLMPTIAEAQAVENNSSIKKAIFVTIKYCLLFGILFTGIFLFFGYDMGRLLFGEPLAGSFIITLAWICPLLFLSTTLGSILHGLGKTVQTFLSNMVGLSIRIFFVFFMIPRFGITGYLWGLLASQLITTLMCFFQLNRSYKIEFPAAELILKPTLCLIVAVFISRVFYQILNQLSFPHALIPLALAAGMLSGAYLILLLANGTVRIRKGKSGFFT